MSSYIKILGQFIRLGLSEASQLSETELKRALDEIAAYNGKLPRFNAEVADELLADTEKNPSGTVNLRDFVNVIMKAQGCLKENIQKC